MRRRASGVRLRHLRRALVSGWAWLPRPICSGSSHSLNFLSDAGLRNLSMGGGHISAVRSGSRSHSEPSGARNPGRPAKAGVTSENWQADMAARGLCRSCERRRTSSLEANRVDRVGASWIFTLGRGDPPQDSCGERHQRPSLRQSGFVIGPSLHRNVACEATFRLKQ